MPQPTPDSNLNPKVPPDMRVPLTPSAANWQAYYNGLTDDGKRQAWQNYYANQPSSTPTGQTPNNPPQSVPTVPKDQIAEDAENMVVVELQQTQSKNSFFTLKGQLRSIAVGLACGAAVLLISLFALFNERVITPFIQPNQHVGLDPVVDRNGAPLDTSPKIRIPKINVEIPVDYGVTSSDETQIELALDNGVVHYPTTAQPGSIGNAAFFGHSSNNIFNPGKYKFAFVLLHELVPTDKFFLTYNSKLYTYEVISTQIVEPTEVGVLGPVERQVATATLITCDPPGTSNNRLVVVGKQTDPLPSANDPISATNLNPGVTIPSTPVTLPGNGPSLPSRIWRAIF